MKRESIKKYGILVVAVVVLVAVDQWTKLYAQARLATPGMTDVELEVKDEQEGATVQEFLRAELRANSDEEIAEMANRHTVTYDGQRLVAESQVAAGDRLRVLSREVVVIDGYWDFQYTRNPGAAFGLLANADESFREPFFHIVSLLAVILIFVILRGVPWKQQLFFWGLVLILAGAMGNYIDRVAYGYVIDFVVWKYTDEYRWPTFNVADVLICVGVGALVLEMIRETIEEMRHGGDDDDQVE